MTLDEIVYRLKELRDDLMLHILEAIVRCYEELICERLSETKICPSKGRRGLGRHFKKDDPEGRFCSGGKVRKRGYRRQMAKFFGKLKLPIRVVEWKKGQDLSGPLKI